MSLVYTGLAAGALSAVGSIGGSLIAKDGSKVSLSSQPAPPIFNPTADPLIAGLSLEQLINIGRGDSASVNLLSPGRRLLNQTGGVGTLTNRGTRQASRLIAGIEQIAARHAQQGSDFGAARAEFINFLNSTQIGGRDEVERLVAAAGFTDITDFFAEQFTFEQRRPQLEQETRQVSDSVRQGRNDARTTEAQILSDLFVPTAENLQSTIDERTAAELASVAAFVNEQANVGGFNPAGVLSNQALNANQRGQDNALQFILGLIGSQGSQLGNIESTLRSQEGNAIATGNLVANAQLTNNSLAAQQALALAQSRIAGDAAGANALGSGVASGLTSLGSGLFAGMAGGEPTTELFATPRGVETNRQSAFNRDVQVLGATRGF